MLLGCGFAVPKCEHHEVCMHGSKHVVAAASHAAWLDSVMLCSKHNLATCLGPCPGVGLHLVCGDMCRMLYPHAVLLCGILASVCLGCHHNHHMPSPHQLLQHLAMFAHPHTQCHAASRSVCQATRQCHCGSLHDAGMLKSPHRNILTD